MGIASVVVLGTNHVDPRHDGRQRRHQHAGQGVRRSLATIQWVVTGYTLALATVIPLTGWAASASAPSAST